MRASDPHPKTLLLIDDDAISRELLALLLEGEGFAVLVCDSGKAALEHLRTVGLPYIALTDLHMPGISGAELAAALSPARAKGAVLLAMSASQPGEDIAEAFDGFLLKPFSALEFRSALDLPPPGVNGGWKSVLLHVVKTAGACSVALDNSPMLGSGWMMDNPKVITSLGSRRELRSASKRGFGKFSAGAFTRCCE
jgi:CheY-like chemotaxis protein